MQWLFYIFAQVTNCKPEDIPRFDNSGNLISGNASCQTVFPTVDGNSAVKTGLQTALAIIIGVTVVYIVITALKMVASRGEPAEIAKARDSIIFAAVGLAVVVSAEIIVTFVIGQL